MDTLTSMKVFRLAVELKSFAAASRRLDISPAMASKHVMYLEKRLGTLLLNRTSRHLSLTEAGTIYFEHARQMLDELEAVESAVSKATIAPRGTLKLSVPVWLATPGFVGALNAYRARYPEVRLDVDLSGRFVNLVEEGFDLALRATRPLSLGQTLIARPIGPVAFHVVASPAYLARRGQPLRLGDLAEHDVLGYSLLPNANTIEATGPDGLESVKFEPVLQTNNESLLHLAALDELGDREARLERDGRGARRHGHRTAAALSDRARSRGRCARLRAADLSVVRNPALRRLSEPQVSLVESPDVSGLHRRRHALALISRREPHRWPPSAPNSSINKSYW